MLYYMSTIPCNALRFISAFSVLQDKRFINKSVNRESLFFIAFNGFSGPFPVFRRFHFAFFDGFTSGSEIIRKKEEPKSLKLKSSFGCGTGFKPAGQGYEMHSFLK